MFVYFLTSDNENEWNWLNQTQISNIRELLTNFEKEKRLFNNFAFVQPPKNKIHKNEKNEHKKFHISDGETVFVLNTDDYKPKSVRNEEFQISESPEIMKIVNMSHNEGIITWEVLYKGSEEPQKISHAELKLRNPQLMTEYFQNLLNAE